MAYQIEDIINKVLDSIRVFYKKDYYLLEKNAHERSISHKLAEYMQYEFPDYHVDCEYNLKGLDIKTLDGINECNEQRTTDRVLPDIIIHKRNTDDNLLVIEIKSKDEDATCDIEKLKLFTSREGEYRYALGLFINLLDINNTILQWFENGSEI